MSAPDSPQPAPIDREMLDALRALIDDESDLILEHRHDRGSRSPTRIVFSDADVFTEYIEKQVKPGDAIWCWRFDACCTDSNRAVAARMPGPAGAFRDGGVY